MEVAVKGIKQTITEAPKEEQNSDQTNWVEGLAQSQFRSPCSLVVVGFETSGLEPRLEAHDDVM